jgi:hypothetical protein
LPIAGAFAVIVTVPVLAFSGTLLAIGRTRTAAVRLQARGLAIGAVVVVAVTMAVADI